MAQFVNIFDVDLQRTTNPVPLRQMIGEGDSNGLRVGAHVYDDGVAVALGGSCVGKVVRADGATVQLTGTISGNTASVVLDQTSCAVEGPIQVAVCWVSGSNITTLVLAYGSVVHTQTGNAIQPSTPIPDLAQLLAEIENMRTATAAANTAASTANTAAANAAHNFAGAFSDSTAYTAGQYVTYTDGNFYRFTTNHAAGSWNSAQVVRVTAGAELDDIKSALNLYEYNKNQFNKALLELNTYIDTTDGTKKYYDGFDTTDYISVPDHATGVYVLGYITLDRKYANKYAVAQYDENNLWIGSKGTGQVIDGLKFIIFDPGTKYIRVLVGRNDYQKAAIIFDINFDPKSVLNVFPYVGKNYDGVINSTGNITSHDSFGYTSFIPIPKWAHCIYTYNVVTLAGVNYTLHDYQFALYDENYTFIRLVTGNTTAYYVNTPIDPSEAAYVRINFGKNNENDSVCIFKETMPTDHKWDNKTGDFLGDSITEQNQFTSKLASLFGIRVNNYGVPGTTISNIVASGTFSSRVSEMSTSCDFVFMLGGTNDWGLGAPLGTKTDTTENTFYGGLYATLSALRAKFPTKPIFVSTILQRDYQGGPQAAGIDTNSQGNSLMEFNAAIIYMAHRFGCIVIDGFGESGICISNITTYCSDRLHLNATGGTRYATFIKDCMEQVSPY